MLYPDNFEQKTGFDQIRQMINDFCISTLGKYYTRKMRFSKNYQKVKILLDQTEEFRQILLSGDHFPASSYFDPMDMFDTLKLEGTFAEAEDLSELRASLITIREILAFLQIKKTEDTLKYPVLHELSKDIYVDPSITKELDRIIDEKNNIRSNASATLAEIRRKKSSLESQAARRINQIMGQAKKEGWVAGDAELALRNSRQVLPVPSAYKRKIKGFVHDSSSTGQTVFLEPEEVFEINNELRQLELDERQEIIRILKSLADFLRPFLTELKTAFYFLGKMDFIRAKALTAIEMDAEKPRLSENARMEWIKAKHPLLWLAYKPLKKHVEPLSLHLEKQNRIIVISGPNAGGKSVCLKTTGLIQYMLQCGLLVPMEDYSEAGIFHKIFIDIGDEQSLENDLSTYSSHLSNMRFFLKNADEKTLFLIDEFGAGTEPNIGGAIAEAILEMLTEKNALGVITTHYANLKILAGKKEGIVNGSMLFDTAKMRPLYRLKAGNPGSSFAFEIAKTMGIPQKILEKAEAIAGTDHIDFDRQLQDMELKKLELEEKEKQLKSGDTFLSEMIEKYEQLNADLNNQKQQIINEAKREAKKILTDSNRMIEKTIKEIRESSAEKEKTKNLRANLENYTQEYDTSDHAQPYESKTKQQKKKKKKLPQEQNQVTIEKGPISEGDTVRIIGQQTLGEVIKTDRKDAEVAFGSIIMRTPLKKLEKIRKKESSKSHSRVKVKYDFDINTKAAEFNPNLDIRGQKADEALIKARRFVDDAILLGRRQLKIVHGTGEGILREALRDYLRTLPEVIRAKDEHADRGGAGCTVIQLK